MIVGIDEVGRGPWAGPLVVGAVVLGDATIEGLTDSKKLKKLKRESLSAEILDKAASVGLGWVDAAEIDEIGLSEALKVATRRALEQITVPYHEIIIDGTVNFLADTGKGKYVTTMKKADLLVGSVSAASILAKVARDDFMSAQDEVYPGYGFGAHVGYGTAKHKAAIHEHGVTMLHRKSFAPIAAMLGKYHVAGSSIEGTNKASGDRGEAVAIEWLKSQGYEILEHNWKTKFCEIDIVARKREYFYFVEVKHRKKPGQGGGTAAITPAKLRRMKFAATMYLKSKRLLKSDAMLAVITTSGISSTFESYLELT